MEVKSTGQPSGPNKAQGYPSVRRDCRLLTKSESKKTARKHERHATHSYRSQRDRPSPGESAFREGLHLIPPEPNGLTIPDLYSALQEIQVLDGDRIPFGSLLCQCAFNPFDCWTDRPAEGCPTLVIQVHGDPDSCLRSGRAHRHRMQPVATHGHRRGHRGKEQRAPHAEAYQP